MSTLEHDEDRFVTALHDPDAVPGSAGPDPDRLATVARRGGARLRRRRRAAVCAVAVAVAGIGTTAVALGHGGHGPARSALPIAATGGHATAHHQARLNALKSLAAKSTRHAKLVRALADAYAVLDAPGWTAPQGPADDKLYYVNGADSLSLNWRPAADFSPKWGGGVVVGHTTIDGDPADIYGDSSGGVGEVVGPIKDGRFLTLAGSAGVTLDQLTALAAQVHRQ
jgi:hypothetical protein